MLMVRCSLLQMVGLAVDFCGPWHATPGPTLFWPVPVGGLVALQGALGFLGSLPQRGMGPRELPR